MHIILWSYVCPSVCFKPTQFQGEISPRLGKDIYKILQKTILISLCLGFFPKMSLNVCVATFLSIQANLRPDLTTVNF